MENKINIAELLKDCPKGMELYSTIYGTVYFEGVRDTGNAVLIDVKTSCNTEAQFYPDGKFNTYYSDSEMTLFPSKDVRTWEGFIPPCKFEDGAVLVHTQNQRFIMSIYHERTSELTIKTHCILWDRGEGLSVGKEICYYVDSVRLATEEEKEELFQAIKEHGYKWNEETKTLEKLIVPKFKVGDRIKYRSGEIVYRVVHITEDTYVLDNLCSIPILMEHMYNLVPDKFNINTLTPFESKVLVRDTNSQDWTCSFYSHYNIKDQYPFYCINYGRFKQCIPYEGNEHLLGKTDDCDNFYKTWEK